MGPVAVVTRENIAGNMVMLSLDGGAHVLYAHLVPGSLKVKRDDRLKKGDVLAALSNVVALSSCGERKPRIQCT